MEEPQRGVRLPLSCGIKLTVCATYCQVHQLNASDIFIILTRATMQLNKQLLAAFGAERTTFPTKEFGTSVHRPGFSKHITVNGNQTKKEISSSWFISLPLLD